VRLSTSMTTVADKPEPNTVVPAPVPLFGTRATPATFDVPGGTTPTGVPPLAGTEVGVPDAGAAVALPVGVTDGVTVMSVFGVPVGIGVLVGPGVSVATAVLVAVGVRVGSAFGSQLCPATFTFASAPYVFACAVPVDGFRVTVPLDVVPPSGAPNENRCSAVQPDAPGVSLNVAINPVFVVEPPRIRQLYTTPPPSLSYFAVFGAGHRFPSAGSITPPAALAVENVNTPGVQRRCTFHDAYATNPDPDAFTGTSSLPLTSDGVPIEIVGPVPTVAPYAAGVERWNKRMLAIPATAKAVPAIVISRFKGRLHIPEYLSNNRQTN
jgi:hypothetical protein